MEHYMGGTCSMRGRTREYIQSNISVPGVHERKRPCGHTSPDVKIILK
jgi:hypothetical protein